MLPPTKACGAGLLALQDIQPLPSVTRVFEKRLPAQPKTKKKPISTYVVQGFREWISWFLSLENIEDEIENWQAKLSTEDSQDISDYNQSPAAKHLQSGLKQLKKNSTNSLNLAFSLFADWFNPLGNKIAGRQVSIGVLAMHCMNLPPESWHKMKHTYLAGMVPAPNQPDMTTISHVLSPLIHELLELDRGIKIPTYRYPDGRRVFVRLQVLVGDMVGNHKVAGFTSHSGTFFCSWCMCDRKELYKMKIGMLRTRRGVLDAAHSWKNGETLRERAAKVKRTGVRWSELNRLPYWDPVKNVGLGVMHNWYEGVLQNHFRFRWVFSIDSEQDEQELKDAELELDGVELQNGDGWLSQDLIKIILRNLQEVKVPEGITRCPRGLGTKANGKLKASEWKALFSTHLPLAAFDVFIGNYEKFSEGMGDAYLQKILTNFCPLVKATHIISSKKLRPGDAERFKRAYFEYTVSSSSFEENWGIKPNHHYAIHSASQMSWWGPLGAVAEFTGERLCGFLQKINTNGKVGEYVSFR